MRPSLASARVPGLRALILASLLSLLPAATALARAPVQAPPVTLQQEVERLAGQLRGSVGVGVLHVQSGRTAYLAADRPFPMASTMKLPVAVHILALVDEGALSLRQQVVLGENDVFPEMGGPMDLHLTAGSAITVRDLLHMMITVSDNNATDILLRLGGGTGAVTARMHALGIDGLRVDRYIWELLANYYGDDDASQQAPLDPAAYRALAAAERSAAQRRDNIRAWNADPRDTSSARAMTDLLARLWRGELLAADTTAVLQDILRQTRTGGARLRGMLPARTPVAHKTGTVGDSINDVGVISLPHDRGEVVVSVFVQSDATTAERDAAIAQIARAAHDYFLFAP